MRTPEFKSQIFKTSAQWESGLLRKLVLEPQPEGSWSLTLMSTPTFTGWREVGDGGRARAIAVDECDRLYAIEEETARRKPGGGWILKRYEPGRGTGETVLRLHTQGCRCGGEIAPRMLIDPFTLWILEGCGSARKPGSRRVWAFSTETFQLKYVVESPGWIIDMALDSKDHFLLLEELDGAGRIRQFHRNGGRQVRQIELVPSLKEPVGLDVADDGRILVIDRKGAGLHEFSQQGHRLIPFETPDGGKPEPNLIAIHPSGAVLVGDRKGPRLLQFDREGGYLATIPLPEPPDGGVIGEIRQIAFDARQAAYLLTDRGIARFDLQGSPVGAGGVYYSPTLDNGRNGGLWHRMALQAVLPRGGVIEVSYAASDDASLKSLIDSTLADPGRSAYQKSEALENALWRPQRRAAGRESSETVALFAGEALEAADSPESDASGAGGREPAPRRLDALFQRNQGRYLWLRLALSTFDENSKPSLRRMTVFRPRLSYLRYLPATYQADAVSQSFLERFLSLFETVFFDLDVEITEIFRHFDAETAPDEFLDWLGGWLNLAIEEDWSPDLKRAFIRRASDLFRRKGTPRGLSEIVSLLTGRAAVILEHARLAKPMLLRAEPWASKDSFRLGVDSVVAETPTRGFSLGEEAILGAAALRDVVERPEDAFLASTHRFTLLLGLTRKDYKTLEKRLGRVLAEFKPAHTECAVRLVGGDARVGVNAFLSRTGSQSPTEPTTNSDQFETWLADIHPFRLGVCSTVGRSALLAGGEPGGRLERNSVLGGGLELI